MKIGILGHFARGTALCDGQTVKTRNIEQALCSRGDIVGTVDSYQWKKHPFSFFFRIVKLVLKNDIIFMLPDAGGIKVYPYLINLFAFKRKVKIYSVVGGWLPSFLKKNKRIKRQLLKFDHILVETRTMQSRLQKQGFGNVTVVPNFKNILPLAENQIKYDHESPFRFCIFSRIMKQKGIEDAVFAVNELNQKRGKLVCILDIYGPIQDEYKEEFFALCNAYSFCVFYKGIASPEKSVEILKDYYMLLFPTRFYTEGIPGTIIDAFSAGVPVLASEWESYSDVLTDGDSVTYAFGSQEALLEKLEYCVMNAEIINDYRKECLRSAKKFSMDMAIQIIFDACEKKNESFASNS